VATSIHKLTPYDVAIVAAMGDSITAAFAACAHCIIEIVEECRGASWSIGGVDDFASSITLPNIIKQYNPNLTGFSTGSNIAKLPGLIDPRCFVDFALGYSVFSRSEFFHAGKNAGLNVAVSGAVASDLLAQARDLVERLKNHKEEVSLRTASSALHVILLMVFAFLHGFAYYCRFCI
jgi:hypothetical protein